MTLTELNEYCLQQAISKMMCDPSSGTLMESYKLIETFKGDTSKFIQSVPEGYNEDNELVDIVIYEPFTGLSIQEFIDEVEFLKETFKTVYLKGFNDGKSK